MLLILAATVAFLVQVYSLGYLEGDPRYPSYAALVSVFTGAMSTVVVADDLWVLLVGWELMGACSYFLISHHWELREARAGAVKAFLMTGPPTSACCSRSSCWGSGSGPTGSAR